MKVTLGDKQYIELNTVEVLDQTSFGYSQNIVLNSFQTGYHEDGYGTEEEAFEAGVLSIHECIQDHINESNQKMSDIDMELVLKFLEEIKQFVHK